MDFLFAATSQKLSDNVQISIISAVSGIIIAYIVNVAARKVQANKAEKQPKDRMEQMFDGYERLIKQKDTEDDRKQHYIKTIEKELQLTKDHVATLESALELTSDELAKSRSENADLKKMLDAMRKEYKVIKNES